MIIKLDYFTIKCDNCGKIYSDILSGYAAWSDKRYAEECATETDEWLKDGNKHYCPNCYEYDDDNLVIIQNKHIE